MTWQQSAVVLLLVALAAGIGAWCNERAASSVPITPTPTIAVIVLPSSTAAAGVPASPSPAVSATPSQTPVTSPGAVVVGETRIPPSTRKPTATATLTPEPTQTRAPATMQQRG